MREHSSSSITPQKQHSTPTQYLPSNSTSLIQPQPLPELRFIHPLGQTLLHKPPQIPRNPLPRPTNLPPRPPLPLHLLPLALPHRPHLPSPQRAQPAQQLCPLALLRSDGRA